MQLWISTSKDAIWSPLISSVEPPISPPFSSCNNAQSQPSRLYYGAGLAHHYPWASDFSSLYIMKQFCKTSTSEATVGIGACSCLPSSLKFLPPSHHASLQSQPSRLQYGATHHAYPQGSNFSFFSSWNSRILTFQATMCSQIVSTSKISHHPFSSCNL